MSASLTPEFVRSLTEPTKRFLCPLSANTYGVEFLSFVISDYETKDVIFDVAKDYDMATADLDPSDPDSARTIRYSFSADVLRCPAIATECVPPRLGLARTVRRLRTLFIESRPLAPPPSRQPHVLRRNRTCDQHV